MQKKPKTWGVRYQWDTRERGVALRPWRLYATPPGAASDPTTQGRNLPYRCYGDEVRAHNAAIIAVRWGDYRTIEVYDSRVGLESGTYTMHANGTISFSAPTTSRIVGLLMKKGVKSNG